MRRRLAGVALTLLAGGCCVKPPPAKPPYYGPTDDLPELVAKLNARANRLDSLRAEGSFDADFVDPRTQKHDGGSGDVTLLYRPPRDLRLVGKVFTERVFDIGSNAAEFWMSLNLPQQKRLLVGTRDADQNDLAQTLPLRPETIAEVLGVSTLSPDLLRQPAPVLRFNHDEDCYAVTYQVRQPDRWAVQKEVWYDRATLHPRRVLMYGPTGRVVLRAELSEPKPIDKVPTGATADASPLELPSRYALTFTDTGSTFTLRLSRLERERNGVPNDRSFNVPLPPPGAKRESLDR